MTEQNFIEEMENKLPSLFKFKFDYDSYGKFMVELCKKEKKDVLYSYKDGVSIGDLCGHGATKNEAINNLFKKFENSIKKDNQFIIHDYNFDDNEKTVTYIYNIFYRFDIERYDCICVRKLIGSKDVNPNFENRKLVRDNIPEIIKNKGNLPNSRILNETEYKIELNKKLIEECNEFILENNIEEIADILEVLDAICNLNKFKEKDILKIKEEKALKNGKFNNKLFLEEIK